MGKKECPDEPSAMGSCMGFAPRPLRERTLFAIPTGLVIILAPCPPTTVGRPLPSRNWAS